MFSGIVQKTSLVVDRKDREGLVTLTMDLGEIAHGLKHGASVALSGVCLTAVSIDETQVSFDIMQETLDKTTLGDLRIGDRVNTERSLAIGEEIGGHRVSGHITGTARISNIQTPANNHIVTFACDSAWMDYILPKGFIAIDGCSLTIVDTGSDWFTVHLIPETLRVTTFGIKQVGDLVNIELDPETRAIVDTVTRILQHRGIH